MSSKMLEKARAKKIYTRLEFFDVLKRWQFPAKFDLISSSDIFVYFENLDTIITAQRKAQGVNEDIFFSDACGFGLVYNEPRFCIPDFELS